MLIIFLLNRIDVVLVLKLKYFFKLI